jgi:predicted ArsR family transcriptional regulator
MAQLIVSERTGDDSGHRTNRRTKDRLLLLLKTRGPMTTKMLAEALGISVPAIRQHLKSLAGAVDFQQQASGVGRPAQSWSLTGDAQGKFPDTHSELTVQLLQSVTNTLGSEALDRVIADRYQENEQRYVAALKDLSSLSGRLKRLVQLRTAEGYMAELEKTRNGWLLIENHCPICAAASHCQGFCDNELALFQSVLGQAATVARAEYLLAGGRRCTYEITATW